MLHRLYKDESRKSGEELIARFSLHDEQSRIRSVGIIPWGWVEDEWARGHAREEVDGNLAQSGRAGFGGPAGYRSFRPRRS